MREGGRMGEGEMDGVRDGGREEEGMKEGVKEGREGRRKGRREREEGREEMSEGGRERCHHSMLITNQQVCLAKSVCEHYISSFS